jgi:hypothetical protein
MHKTFYNQKKSVGVRFRPMRKRTLLGPIVAGAKPFNGQYGCDISDIVTGL